MSHITMVKKVLVDGSACRKCAEAEAMLKRRKLWDRIDRVVIAHEGDDASEGALLAQAHGVDRAPFFLVEGPEGVEVFESPLLLIRAHLKRRKARPGFDLAGFVKAHAEATPEVIVAQALSHFGDRCAIAFSGAEDVAVIHMAHASGHPFRVFTLDTGRLHPETLAYVETIRNHYGVAIEVLSPDAPTLEAFVRERGLFSFYDEGHKDCCGVRKVAPLRRVLGTTTAWMTGQRRDQSPETRGALSVVEEDGVFEGVGPGPLVKFNPLAAWDREAVWAYLEREGVPTNPLHTEGFRSIGCAPCTRPTGPDQHERDGRWWWEGAEAKECGLHQAGDAGEING